MFSHDCLIPDKTEFILCFYTDSGLSLLEVFQDQLTAIWLTIVNAKCICWLNRSIVDVPLEPGNRLRPDLKFYL